jgi:hypothetical protein
MLFASLCVQDMSGAGSVRSGGFSAPYNISNEQLEKDRYVARYINSKNPRRSNRDFKGDYEGEERPPPYSEKNGFDDSRSHDFFEDDQSMRGRRRGRDDEVEDSLCFYSLPVIITVLLTTACYV